MTAKPIFAVGIPRSAGLMEIDRIQERLSEQLTDYHVLLYTHYSHETVLIVLTPPLGGRLGSRC